jgi:hypothetical protein
MGRAAQGQETVVRCSFRPPSSTCDRHSLAPDAQRERWRRRSIDVRRSRTPVAVTTPTFPQESIVAVVVRRLRHPERQSRTDPNFGVPTCERRVGAQRLAGRIPPIDRLRDRSWLGVMNLQVPADHRIKLRARSNGFAQHACEGVQEAAIRSAGVAQRHDQRQKPQRALWLLVCQVRCGSAAATLCRPFPNAAEPSSRIAWIRRRRRA